MIEPELLTPADVEAVLALADRAESHDGVAPLSEEFRLALRDTSASQLVERRDGVVVWAAVRTAGGVEIVVDPDHRRRGIGSALLAAVGEAAPGSPLWAHGDLPGAQALAAAAGLRPVRELLKLGRALTAADAARPPADGVRSLADHDDHDDGAAAAARERHLNGWLALNALAFADHPEQGRWSRADLDARLAEDWFDPATLWLQDGAVGSVWVKHPVGEPAEIYVLAVHPDHGGRGLGRRLLDHALGHVARAGASEIELYVDGGNAAARALYERAGFDVRTRDVQYAT